MSDRTMNNSPWAADPNFAPYDANEHALELEKRDLFNRLTDDTIPVKGGLLTRLQELAAAGNPEVLAVLEEHGVDDPRVPKTFFCGSTPGKIFAHENGWTAVITDENGLERRFSNSDRDACMMQVSAYVDRARQPRLLSEPERIRICRLAQARKIQEAIVEYLKCRLGNADLDSPEADVRYRHVYNQAAFDVWRYSENTYVRNPQFEQLLGQVAEEKPLTFRLIADLYRSYCTQKPNTRPAPENLETEPVVSDEDLERLSDSEIAALHLGVAQNRARNVSRVERETLGT